MTEAPAKKTVGEELFLVHLSRLSNQQQQPHEPTGEEEEDDDDDIEAEPSETHKPAMTVGEELWRIHCKRTAGSLDEDNEDESLLHNGNNNGAVQQLVSSPKRVKPDSENEETGETVNDSETRNEDEPTSSFIDEETNPE